MHSLIQQMCKTDPLRGTLVNSVETPPLGLSFCNCPEMDVARASMAPSFSRAPSSTPRCPHQALTTRIPCPGAFALGALPSLTHSLTHRSGSAGNALRVLGVTGLPGWSLRVRGCFCLRLGCNTSLPPPPLGMDSQPSSPRIDSPSTFLQWGDHSQTSIGQRHPGPSQLSQNWEGKSHVF